MTIASTPSLGRQLSRSKIASALRRGGRQRRTDERAAEIQAALRSEQLTAPDLVVESMGSVAKALVALRHGTLYDEHTAWGHRNLIAA